MAATGAGAGLALAGRPLLRTRAVLVEGSSWQALPLDALLLFACAAALATCCLWLLTITVATAVEAVTGMSSAALRAITPHVVRRGVLVTCGLAVGSATLVGPASAATESGPDATPGSTASRVLSLDGLPLPDRPAGGLDARSGGARREAPRPRPQATTTGPDSPAVPTTGRPTLPSSARFRAATAAAEPPSPLRYEVRRGDSLWSIARRIRPRGGLAEVDRTWRLIYRTNRPEIGADPDLVVPGTTLRLPVRPAGAQRLHGPPRPGPLPHRKDAP